MKKFNGILKITNKKSGFFHYFNPKEAATFISKNGSKNYDVKEIKEINFEEIFYISLSALLIISYLFATIFFS
tara:strand:+ start:585 stop:803 length:219 start_codon:yes stop_codon:yes gene_type:complete